VIAASADGETFAWELHTKVFWDDRHQVTNILTNGSGEKKIFLPF
jgi:hypothetical protein